MLKLQTGKDGKVDITFSDEATLGKGKLSRNTFRTATSAGRRKTKEFHQSHVLPKQKGGQGKLSRSHDIAKQENSKGSPGNDAIDAATSTLPSRKAPRQKPGGQGMRKVNGEGLNSLKSNENVKRKNSQPGGIQTDAGFITQSQLNSILRALVGNDNMTLDSLTNPVGENNGKQDDLKNTKQSSSKKVEEIRDQREVTKKNEDWNQGNFQKRQGGSIPNQSTTSDQNMVTYHAADYDPWARVLPANHQKVSGLTTSGVKDTGFEPQKTSQPAAMRSSFAIGAPGLVAYDLEEQKRQSQKQWVAELNEQVRQKKQTESEAPNVNQKSRTETSTVGLSTSYSDAGQSTMLTPRTQPQAYPAAMASSFTLGAPGVVAFDLERERRLRQKEYMSDIKDQIARKQESTNPGTNWHDTPHRQNLVVNQPQSIAHATQREESTMLDNDNTVSYGRGNFHSRNPVDADKVLRDREKHLEHQRAIQEQVEEKRRKKMEERERKIQEELEEERKLTREREFLKHQYEEEVRKKREKEEAERQRLQELQERVREAYESAQRDKLQGKIRKLKAAGHDTSKLEDKHHIQANSQSSPETHRESSLLNLDLQSTSSIQEMPLSSTRSVKEHRPVMNWGSSPEDEKRTSKNSDVESRKQSRKSVERKVSDRSHKSSRDESIVTSRSDVESRLTSEQQNGRKTKKKKIASNSSSKENAPVRNKSNSRGKEKGGNGGTNPLSRLPKDQTSQKQERPARRSKKRPSFEHEDETASISDVKEEKDSVVPYHRTMTITLENDARVLGDEEQEEEVMHDGMYDILRTPTIQLQREATVPQEVFTPRQQQILEQLQALRKGLMDKRREHEREAAGDHKY